jgi:hypothetical protein
VEIAVTRRYLPMTLVLSVVALVLVAGSAVAGPSADRARSKSPSCAGGYRLCVEGGRARSPWNLTLRRPQRKEAASVRVGDIVWVTGWSPSSFKGERFELCVAKTGGRCVKGARPLNGGVQLFDVWKLAKRDTSGGLFRLRLRVKGKARAGDAVAVV